MWGIVVALVLVLGVAGPASAADHPPEQHGYAPAGEGATATTLHYRLRLPDPERFGPGPYPAVVNYSGYLPAFADDGIERIFLDEGWAFIGLNLRGSGCSGGHYDFFSPVENRLGADAVEWLAQRPWSNGRLAMVNKSYPGISQLFIAGERPRGLVAIVPGHALSDLYRDVAYPGGILNATFVAGFGAPRLVESYVAGPRWAAERGDQECARNQAGHAANAVDNPLLKALQHPYEDETWVERSPSTAARRIEVPTMVVDAWQDEQTGSRSAALVEALPGDVPWRLIGTNGDHNEYYGPGVLPEVLRFLRVHLAERAPDGGADPGGAARRRYLAEPRVQVNFDTTGEERRPAWIERFEAWPPREVEPLAMDLGERTYAYAPGAGSQQRGGFSAAGEPAASWSERPPAGTQAVWDLPVLERDLVLAGTASADLVLSSTAPDTDLQVTLSEVRPDGRETFVAQGWLRASHRALDPRRSTPLRPWHPHRREDVQPLVPGTPALARVEVLPFAHAVRAGSRLRLSVEAPHTKPDLWGFAPLSSPARNTIHAGSRLVLPAVRGARARAPLPPCGSLRSQPCR